MRVIAGCARSLPLKSVPGSGTRPTTDRIKETLFNMIAQRIPGARFLDLFAGSGAIGIEALSRGAQCAVFVEKNPAALKVIRRNLEFTRLADRAQILSQDAVKAISSFITHEPFDVIFMDPPYGHDLERRILDELKDSDIADGNTLIIIEADMDTDFSYLDQLGYEMKREKKYGSNRHLFVTMKHR